jgi:hypothetical protein
VILRDFQISAAGDSTQQRSLNWAAFPVAEAVRLDLKQRRPEAPFAKIQVTLGPDFDLEPRLHVALGICEVFVRVDLDRLVADLPATRSFVDLARSAMEVVGAHAGFLDPGINAVLTQCCEQVPPCQQRLDRLTRTTRDGIRCETWFVAEYGRSRVEARFFAGEVEMLRSRLAEQVGPVILEHWFPVARSRGSAGRDELLDRSGVRLAESPLPLRSS